MVRAFIGFKPFRFRGLGHFFVELLMGFWALGFRSLGFRSLSELRVSIVCRSMETRLVEGLGNPKP